MAAGGSETEQLSDEIFDFVCTMCKRKDRNREAERYCVDCNDFYCLTCVKVHDDVPSLTAHKIVQKGQFPRTPGPATPVAPTERCDKHPHKLVDMYCQTHDDVCCAVCMAAEHRACQDLFYIPEFIDSDSSSASADILKKLASTAKSLSECHDFFQREKLSLTKKKTVSLENIRKFRKEIDDRFDELEKVCVADIENRFQELEDNLDEAENLLQANKARIKSAQDNILAAGNNMSQVFVSLKIGRNVGLSAEHFIDENEVFTKIEDIEFEANKQIAESLEPIKSLGEIRAGNRQTGVFRVTAESFASSNLSNIEYEGSHSLAEDDNGDINVEEESALLQISGRKTHNVRIQSDEITCTISSACVLEDGTIVLCDRDNNKLKYLDGTMFTVRSHFDLDSSSWQMCHIKGQVVAVSFGYSKNVQFVSVGHTNCTTNSVKTEHGCYGLACENDRLYISDKHTSVYIYTLSGRKLKQFSIDLLSGGGGFLSSLIRPVYMSSIAVSPDGSKIYVSHLNNGLIILNNNGQVAAHYKGHNLRGARACHHLTRGEDVLVCGQSNNVLQIGPPCHMKGEVLKSDGGSKDFRAVCCDQQICKMIVTRVRNDFIEVYDLS